MADHAPHVSGDNRTLVGVGASGGRATGPVRIVGDQSGLDAVKAGDVLVAPTTSPAWTPVFAVIAAVVTDVGSVAAHAAIVAREFAIPAVVATGDATRRLHDGDVVTVDGTTGTVHIH
jgi:pyruvate,water dikinase